MSTGLTDLGGNGGAAGHCASTNAAEHDVHRPCPASGPQNSKHWASPMIYRAGTCGLRFAEVIGLRVGHIDVAGRQLHVVHTAPQAGGDRAEPKSVAGRRAVPMTSFVAGLDRD